MANLTLHGGSYADLDAALGPKKSRRTVGHNTFIQHNANGIALYLHGTPVYWVDDHDVMTLNSGGYETPTTKDRINQMLPASVGVIQKKFRWYLWNRHTGGETPFRDGMKVDRRSGAVLGGSSRRRRRAGPRSHAAALRARRR